jgi:hypothetical protein
MMNAAAMDAPITQAQFQELLANSRYSRMMLAMPEKSPPVGWLTAGIVAVAINFFAVPYIQTNNIPYVTQALADAVEWENDTAIDLGVIVKDTIIGTDRTPPPLQAGQSMIGLTQAQTSALALSVSFTESRHNYNRKNWAFYLGRWQFGASALAQVGLIKRANFEAAPRCVENGLCQKAFLMNSANWTIPGGYTRFMRDHALQDKAFIALCNHNVKEGFRLRVLSKATSPERIAGFIKAAHLKGVGGAKKWYKYGVDSKEIGRAHV